jgi:hypothetical protein
MGRSLPLLLCNAAVGSLLFALATPSVAKDLTERKAETDWQGASTALQRHNFFAAVPLRRDVTSAIGRSSVPVILPQEFLPSLTSAHDYKKDEVGRASFHVTDDGYTAVLVGRAYDLIVEATNSVLSTGEQKPLNFVGNFSEEDGGNGSLALRVHGVSILLQFVCKTGPPCVSAEEATAYATRMVVLGGQQISR